MKAKITLKDIAKELDVSVSTVSKALNDSHEISEETKQRIRAYAEYYKYKPNSLALKLRTQRTLIIGVIVPQIVHHFWSTVIRGIEEYANAKGYNVMICLSNESYEKEVSNVDMLLEGSVDGMLISASRGTQEKANYEHISKLVQNQFPVVLFDRVIDAIECDKVIIDDEGGAFKATQHLIETGCKKIALITHPEYVKISSLRIKGYKKALQKHNLPIDENAILQLADEKDIQQQIELLFKNDYPDAILAVNGEIYASVAMQIAKDKGLKVPEDISIITFTDGLISKYSSPPLTTLVQHGFEMGKQAVELLINQIENESDAREVQKKVLSTNLNIRKSTR